MRLFFTFLVLMGICPLFAQKNIIKKSLPDKPKLVVGIVVDQMRYDYLYRYASKYGDGGFKRMMNDGFNCRNNHYHYAQTTTGPGHAAVYTGSVPAVNGIIGNEWFDPFSKKFVYVTDDSTVTGIGAPPTNSGKMSPRNMHTSTITDQLRLSNNFQSKVIGVAIKDRGAILPAGHSANAAYWFDTNSGNWISSTYYMSEMPEWAKNFNAQKRSDKLMQTPWNTLLPISQYTESEADKQDYEVNLPLESEPTFPHQIKNYAALPISPYGNTLTKEFALAALKNERLGQGVVTDFLCISFSSPDYIGHSFGTHAIEIQDCYLRLDRDIAEILTTLDQTLGKDNYLTFLTADHGVADIPAFLQKHKIPAGVVEGAKQSNYVQQALAAALGEGKWVLASMNNQLYLNQDLMDEKKVSLSQVTEIAKKTLLTGDSPLYQIFDFQHFNEVVLPDYYRNLINGIYNPKRSGNIMMIYEPAWFIGNKKGTTHGAMWNYDTHVPLLWYGWKIPHGETVERTHISDIAPTLAVLLKILEPNGCVGKPLKALLTPMR